MRVRSTDCDEQTGGSKVLVKLTLRPSNDHLVLDLQIVRGRVCDRPFVRRPERSGICLFILVLHFKPTADRLELRSLPNGLHLDGK